MTLEFFDAVDNSTVVLPNEHYVCYSLTVRNIDAPTGLHIHEVSSSAGNPHASGGPVVVDLLDGRVSNGATTCVVVAESTFDGIQADPPEYFANVHNPAFLGGAISSTRSAEPVNPRCTVRDKGATHGGDGARSRCHPSVMASHESVA